MVLDSPFRGLGLPATASDDDIRARLGAKPDAAALRLLEDPGFRAHCEVLWLHTAESDSADGSATERALVRHAAAVRLTVAYETGGEDVDPQALIAAWRDVETSDAFWSYLAERTTVAVEPLRAGLGDAVLGLVARRVVGLVESGRLGAARVPLAAIAASEFDVRTRERAIATSLTPLLGRLAEGTRRLDDGIAALPRSGDEAAFDALEELAVTQLLAPYAQLRHACGRLPELLAVIEAAGSLRWLSVRASQRLPDRSRGYLLLGLATHMTPSRERTRALAAARSELHRHLGVAAEADGELVRAAAHFDLAARAAPIADERRELEARTETLIERHGLPTRFIEACEDEIEGDLEQRAEALDARVRAASGGYAVDGTPPRPAVPEPAATLAPRDRRRLALGLVGVAISLLLLLRACADERRDSATAWEVSTCSGSCW